MYYDSEQTNNDCAVYNPDDRCCNCCTNNCLKVIFGIFAALFLFALGLLIGAVLASTILGSIAAFVILATILFVLAVVTLIYILCRKSCNFRR